MTASSNQGSIQLGIDAFYAQDYSKVIEYLNPVLNGPSPDIAHLIFLGWAYYHQGCENESLKDINRAIEILMRTLNIQSQGGSTNYWEVHDALGWCFQRKGDYARALDHFDVALSLVNIKTPSILNDLQSGRALAQKMKELNNSAPFIDSLQNPKFFSNVPLTQLDLPEYIEIEPTKNCNLRCLQCHVSYEELAKERLDLKFLDHMEGLEGKWVVLGSNYEPMVHPQFGEIVQGLTSRKLKIDLTTNGTLFTPTMIEKTKDANFRNIIVSFDGFKKETFEKIRRNADYEETIERILNFRKAVSNPDAYFAVNYTVLRSNIDEITEAVKFWNEAGFDHMGVIVMVMRFDHETLRRETPEPEMERFYKEIEKAASYIVKNNTRITLSSAGLNRDFPMRLRNPELFVESCVRSRNPEARTPFNAREYYQNGPYPGMPVGCRSPFKFARILHTGEVQLCYQFIIGNIYQESFEDILFGKNAERVRDYVMKQEKVCTSCDYFNFCIRAGEVDYSHKDSFYHDRILGDSASLAHIGRYQEYQIMQWVGQYYGIPYRLGAQINALNLLLAEEFEDLGVVIAPTLEEIKTLIDNNHTQGKRLTESQFESLAEFFIGMKSPALVESITDYNILAWNGRYLGVPKSFGSLGNIDIEELESHDKVFSDDEFENVKDQILRFGYEHIDEPVLVGEFEGYNVVFWSGTFYGLSQEIGEIDLTKDTELIKKREDIITRTSLEDAFVAIAQTVKDELRPKDIFEKHQKIGPENMGEYKGYYILKWRGVYYGVPIGSGLIQELHLLYLEYFPEKKYLKASSLEKMKITIDQQPFSLRRCIFKLLWKVRNIYHSVLKNSTQK